MDNNKIFKKSITNSFMNHTAVQDMIMAGTSEAVTRNLSWSQKALREYMHRTTNQDVPNMIGGFPGTKDLNKFVLFGMKSELLNNPVYEVLIRETGVILSTIKTVIGDENKIPIVGTRNPIKYKYPYKVPNMQPGDSIYEVEE